MALRNFFKFTKNPVVFLQVGDLTEWVHFYTKKEGSEIYQALLDVEVLPDNSFNLPDTLIGQTIGYEIIPSYVEDFSTDFIENLTRARKVIGYSLNNATFFTGVENKFEYIIYPSTSVYTLKARLPAVNNKWIHAVGPESPYRIAIFSQVPVKLLHHDLGLELISYPDESPPGVYITNAYERMKICII